MESKDNLLIKMIMKNAHVIALYCDQGTIDEMTSHPKYLKMRDNSNDVYISIEDVCAFEIMSNRKIEEIIPQPTPQANDATMDSSENSKITQISPQV